VKHLPFRHSDSRVICFGFPVSRLLKLWARQHNAAKRLFRLTAEASFQFQCSFGRQSRAVNPLVVTNSSRGGQQVPRLRRNDNRWWTFATRLKPYSRSYRQFLAKTAWQSSFTRF